LRNTSEVVAVTGGRDRAKAVRAAVKSGIIKSLVIDDNGALELMQLSN